MLVALPPERNTLVHADDVDAELAGLLDHRDPGRVAQEITAAVGSVLGIRLPGGDLPALRELVHPREIAILVGIDAAVDQEAHCSLEFLHDARAGTRLLDRQRLAGERARHERQHHAVGVGIEEHVLYELLGAKVLDPGDPGAGGTREPEEVLTGPFRIHEVSLDVEDETAAPELCARELGVLRRALRQHERAAQAARRCIGGVHREQSGRRARRRHEEFAPRDAEAPCVACRFAHCRLVGVNVHGVERNRLELAVGRGVELDRKAQSVGVVAEDAAGAAHGTSSLTIGHCSQPTRPVRTRIFRSSRTRSQPWRRCRAEGRSLSRCPPCRRGEGRAARRIRRSRHPGGA